MHSSTWPIPLQAVDAAQMDPVDDPPDPPPLSILHHLDVPTVDVDEYARATNDLGSRRGLLMAMVVDDGWRWGE